MSAPRKLPWSIEAKAAAAPAPAQTSCDAWNLPQLEAAAASISAAKKFAESLGGNSPQLGWLSWYRISFGQQREKALCQILKATPQYGEYLLRPLGQKGAGPPLKVTSTGEEIRSPNLLRMKADFALAQVYFLCVGKYRSKYLASYRSALPTDGSCFWATVTEFDTVLDAAGHVLGMTPEDYGKAVNALLKDGLVVRSLSPSRRASGSAHSQGSQASVTRKPDRQPPEITLPSICCVKMRIKYRNQPQRRGWFTPLGFYLGRNFLREKLH